MKSLPPLVPRPSVILVLELLGFDDPAMSDRTRRRALELVEHSLDNASEEGGHLLVTEHQVIRIVPIRQETSILFYELMDIVQLQADLLPEGILVRGAMTLGDAAARANRALGSGIARAERLCTEVAQVPRVIVDSRLIRELEGNADLRSSHNTVLQELAYIKELLRQDSDGLWFVDYLKSFRTETRAYRKFLREHQHFIARVIGASAQLDGRSRMWTWLWQYHNTVVDEWHHMKLIDRNQRDEFHIPAASPLLYTFPPSAKPPG